MKIKLHFLKFAAVGALGTALHYGVLIFLVTALERSPATGAMTGATFGAAFNYWLNHRYVFHSDRPHRESLPRFIIMAVIGIVLNGVIVKTLTVANINYLVSQVSATLIILVLNFFLSKLWIFRQIR